MKKNSYAYFCEYLSNKKGHHPWVGQIELTYHCSLNCIHCYCKGRKDKNEELTTREWKKILDEIHREGCIWIIFTGGDPLVRDDFLELYSYAKKKGFIVALLTSGQAFTEKIIGHLVKFPPFSIEITLNGITKNTYETITQVEGSFERTMATIRELKRKNIRLILKSNCLKQNKDEITNIKIWAEENLGKASGSKYSFTYDPIIYPRLNGDTTPCQHRLSFKELLEARKQDPDIWKEYVDDIRSKLPHFKRDRDFLYQCDSWLSQFIVSPYGRLKICTFLDKFSVDLKTISFREGFYNVFPQVLNERFKTKSKCRNCDLRNICHQCPARAFLETGDEEAPVEYYCHLAEGFKKQRGVLNC